MVDLSGMNNPYPQASHLPKLSRGAPEVIWLAHDWVIRCGHRYSPGITKIPQVLKKFQGFSSYLPQMRTKANQILFILFALEYS